MQQQRGCWKRILIVRTDRIGDVLLSTPVIKALRDAFPHSYIAVMIRPYARDILMGNPYLNEVLLYQKRGVHKSWWKSLKFAYSLRKRKFDLAVILHPTNRVHLITFFAGIPERVGYNRKFGFLLTKRLEDRKRFGQKHELEYNLDLLRLLGLQPKERSLFMPIRQENERYIDRFLEDNRITEQDRLVAIHPGASCPSKIWPPDRFAQLADFLVREFGIKVVVVSGPDDIDLGRKVTDSISENALFACGRTTVGQLAALLKRCKLFISNDSGPVHIASAVGTPVIAIFGRSQPGLSPIRWGPTGETDVVLHKDIGCAECLAHRCLKEFACLRAITVQEVLEVAGRFL